MEDVVSAFIEMLDDKINNEIFNVGSGQTYSINSLIKLLGKNKIVKFPKDLVNLTALLLIYLKF